MDNLIDRKVLLREMEELYNKRAVDVYMTGDKEIRVSWNDAVYLVTVAPTIEAEPAKHGRWKMVESGHYAVCTNCRRYWIPIEDKYDYWFCPHCGADMRERSEDGR